MEGNDMKKLTKTTALILSALMLFGCASNSAQSNVGDTTLPSESSVTDSNRTFARQRSITYIALCRVTCTAE